MSHYAFAHDADPIFEPEEETMAEIEPFEDKRAPLTVFKTKLPELMDGVVPEGTYASIPWEEWKILVGALHQIGVCLPPEKNGDE
jgi:hypothetical protein